MPVEFAARVFGRRQHPLAAGSGRRHREPVLGAAGIPRARAVRLVDELVEPTGQPSASSVSRSFLDGPVIPSNACPPPFTCWYWIDVRPTSFSQCLPIVSRRSNEIGPAPKANGSGPRSTTVSSGRSNGSGPECRTGPAGRVCQWARHGRVRRGHHRRARRPRPGPVTRQDPRPLDDDWATVPQEAWN